MKKKDKLVLEGQHQIFKKWPNRKSSHAPAFREGNGNQWEAARINQTHSTLALLKLKCILVLPEKQILPLPSHKSSHFTPDPSPEFLGH